MANSRTLTPEENERLVAALHKLLALDKYAGKQSRLAPDLKIRQPTISGILRGKGPGGYSVARKVANLLRMDVEELLSGKARLGKVRFCDLPGWKEGVPAARSLYPELPPEAFEAVGDWTGSRPPEVISVRIIGDLAEIWVKASRDRADRTVRPVTPDDLDTAMKSRPHSPEGTPPPPAIRKKHSGKHPSWRPDTNLGSPPGVPGGRKE